MEVVGGLRLSGAVELFTWLYYSSRVGEEEVAH